MNHSLGEGKFNSMNENTDGFSDSDGIQISQVSSVFDNQDGFVAGNKRIKFMGSDQNQVGSQIDLFAGNSQPLGLSLKKTPSFVKLIEAKLFETKQISERSRKADVDSQMKLKASNFIATLLRIGNWERVANYEGDLVAKCYYSKRKLVWEVLENGLKSKIEISWSDISAIQVSYPEQNPGILKLELIQAPKFFREHDPQPRRRTIWRDSLDFTGGQATIYRRHYLQFPEGTLEKHFEQLLQYDKELFNLSQRPFPVSNSPFFQSDSGQFPYMLQFSQNHPPFAASKFNQTTRPPFAPNDSPFFQSDSGQFPSMLQFSQNHPPFAVSKFNQTTGSPFAPYDSASPMSVMEMPFSDESIGFPGNQQHMIPFMEPQPEMVNDNQPMAAAELPPVTAMSSSHNEIDQFLTQENSMAYHLLNETDPRQHILDASSATEHNAITPNTCISHDTNKSMELSSIGQSSYGNGEWSNDYQDPTSWILNCTSDPFMKLPRIPSFSSLLFDPSMVKDFQIDDD